MSFTKIIIKKCIALTTRYSPEIGSRILYFITMKRPLNLKKPILFSEKLMYLKLESYIKNPLVWRCVDKLQVRDFLKSRLVAEANMPTIIGIYSDASEIDFTTLPQKFALKCTHGAGFNIICDNKAELDKDRAIQKLNKWLKTPFGLETAETHYGKVRPSIVCEAFIEGERGNLPSDYKVYCFNGKPHFIMACTERLNGLSKVNLFDTEWVDTGYIKDSYASQKPISAPKTLSDMLEMASRVSKGFPFVRVDFYEDKGVAILGELTFTPHACVNTNMTEEGQVRLGELIKLKDHCTF